MTRANTSQYLLARFAKIDTTHFAYVCRLFSSLCELVVRQSPMLPLLLSAQLKAFLE